MNIVGMSELKLGDYAAYGVAKRMNDESCSAFAERHVLFENFGSTTTTTTFSIQVRVAFTNKGLLETLAAKF
jgi:hypothetical protein